MGGNLQGISIVAKKRKISCAAVAEALGEGLPWSSPSALEEQNLAALEQRLAHELMDDEKRQELRDHVLRLRRRLGL
jgi:hypothetical protein